jgi:putative ABC transport system substrate-binding protein
MKSVARSLAGAVALFIAALGAPAVGAKAADKIPRIGYLSPTAGPTTRTESFLQGLRELGYVEGRNIVLEYRWAGGKNERLPDLASDLVGAGVDLIVAGGTPATVAAMKVTRTIPIVFGSAADPVEKGIVASLAHPGGNVTGLAAFVDYDKPLQLLKEAVPQVTRVAFIYEPASLPGAYLEASLSRLADYARALDVTVQPIVLRGPGDAELAFQAIASGTNGVLIDSVAPALLARDRICALAMQHRLPAISFARSFADAGCLMTYGEDLDDMFRRAAGYVDKILKGARPSDLPVEQPTKFDLVVNLKTARALGIELPQAILLRTTEVIE